MRSTLKIFLCIVSFCISGVSFAQDLSVRKRNLDENKRAKLLARGMSEQESAETIARWNAVIEEAYAQRAQTQREEMARMQAAANSGNTSRSTMDVSAPEKAALQALFDGNGGTGWTNNSGWDFNTDVTSSWYGVTVTNGHVTGLTLINNNLINSLPAAIGQLTHLTTLNLFTNNLSGSIPTQISALTSLQTLNLSTNDFTGSIPSQIGQLSALKYLYLDRNNFSGSIPTQIGQLSALLELDLDYNNLTGSIPVEIGNLVALKRLSINQNPSLTGAIPTEIGNLVNMEYIYFISDNLTFLPSSMGNMTNLKMLYINGNDLMTGQIPAGWGSATNFLRLQVDVNKLSGPIPVQLTNLSNLQTLSLDSNELSGDIPDFTGLSNLFLLGISKNKFRFIDFVNENPAYLSNPTLTNYSYNNQAKTDSVISVSGAAGSSVTFEMSADGPPVRYTIDDTFQWYKGVYPSGTLISGATQRTFTIPSLVAGDAGSYYCLSRHPQMTIATNPSHNLVLVRNQIQLTVTAAPSLGACAETFEGATFPPAGWLVANNGVGTTTEWIASSSFMCPGLGTKSAYIATQNIGPGQTSQDWLITPKVTVPANGELRFFTRQQIIGDAMTQFDIKVSPVSQPQSNLGSYTTVQNFSESVLPHTPCNEQKVNLSAYAGQDVYIAFVRTKMQPAGTTVGDGWIVDNVRVVSKCPSVNTISTSNVQQNSLLLSWVSTGAPSYNIEYGLSGITPGNGTVVSSTTNSITISGLTAGTAYQFYVTPICNNCGTYPGETAGPYNTNTLPANFCPAPTNLTITNPTGTTATLGWTETGSATSWIIAVNTFTPGGGIGPNPIYISTNQNPYTITGLQPDSAYRFSVKAKCDNIDSEWTTIIHGDLTNYDCAKKNPEFANNVKHLFLDMVNELLTIMNSGGTIPNGYTSAAVVAMQPYITDANAKIYNFSYVDGVVSFSFAPHAGAPRKDVIIHKYGSSYGLMTDIDLAYFLSPNIYMDNVPASFEFSSSSISAKHIRFCDVAQEPCTVSNPRSAMVKNLFIQLVNHLHDMASNGQPIPDGYNCPQLMALAPYIIDANPRIYNFDASPFSFSFHPPVEGEDPKFDVLIGDWTLVDGVHIANLNISEYQDPTVFMVLDGDIDFTNGKDSDKARIRHIDFCPDDEIDPCPNPIVKQLYLNLLNRLHQMVMDGLPIPNGFSCPELDALRPYLTDPNAAIFNFNAEPFFFSFHEPGKEDEKFDVFFERWPYGPNTELVDIDLSGFLTPNEYTEANATMADGGTIDKSKVRHVNFCPDSGCSRMPEINQLFVNLLNHLHEMTAAGNPIPDGYTCPELTALAPYITDPNPRIYNFQVDPFSFSFHPISKEETPRYDVLMSGWQPSMGNIASIDLSTFSDPNELLNLDGKVTLTDGRSVGKVRVRHIDFCPDSDSDCSRMPQVTQLFINLLSRLHEMAAAGVPIPDGYDCSQLEELRPYLTDPDARIYNFVAEPFSFSFHPVDREEQPGYDVFIDKWDYPGSNIVSINMANYNNPYDFTSLDNMITLGNGTVLEKARVRHINFCPPVTIDCELKPRIAELFRNLLNHMHKLIISGDADNIVDGYDCTELAELRPYLTDPNALIYNFNVEPFSFSFHPIEKNENPKHDVLLDHWQFDLPNSEIVNIDMANYVGPENFTNLDFKVTLANGNVIENGEVRHIDFCPEEVNYCITGNPKAAMVKNLFIALLNHLHDMAMSGTPVPDGYTCPELVALTPYITDVEPKIYQFSPTEFSFSFHDSKDATFDVAAPQWSGQSSDINTIDLINYQSPAFYTSLDSKIVLANGYVIQRAQVRHVNFCPDDFCVNHVAIVVDESGSLTDLEKIKIRRQLKKFVQQQAANNQAGNGNMHISLIGMSDRDVNARSDHKIALKITPANLGEFEAWIDDYGNRYGDPGVTQGSDFWASGLKVALDAPRKPDMVIMITDGCQTGDLQKLNEVMVRFNNYAGNENRDYPHLYVIGIKDGFYVHNTTVQDQRMMASAANTKVNVRLNDPNYNPSLSASTDSFTDEGNVTSSLQLSLKFLFGLSNLQFPSESLNDFREDYYGHDTFQLIGEDHYYLSDRVKMALHIDCGTLSDQDPCDDCFSFQPEPGKTYVLNAWVKEELKVQVTNYANPRIRVVYFDGFKMPMHADTQMFKTSGPIIDGWQRLGGKLEVPSGAVYIDFELLNLSNVAPAFYDDIRIYPIKGTMKSFVYDPETFRLMSELDENNYATFYEYDKEGGLVRVKKETAEGVKTIQETRSGNYLKVQE